MKARFILPLVFLLIPLFSCNKSEEFQFTLYLEYTDSVYICKTINVMIDGQEITTSKLCYTGVSPNVTTITFPLVSGKHTMIAEIIEDSKVFDQLVKFDISQKYGYLTYHNKTSEFSFFLRSTGGLD